MLSIGQGMLKVCSDSDAELVEEVIAVGRASVSGWVTTPFVLVPSNGVFGRFDLAALHGCHTLIVCLFVTCPEQGLKLWLAVG
jgi:hypothetical protein